MLNKRKKYFGVKRKRSIEDINNAIDNDDNLTEEEKAQKRKPKKGRKEKRQQRIR